TTNILFTKLNSLFDIGSVKYNGTTFTLVGEQSLTADTTVTTYEGHSIAFRLKPEPSFTEQLGVTVSLGRTEVLKRTAAEQLGVTVSLGRTEVLKRTAAEQLGVTVSMGSTVVIKRTAAEQLVLI